MFLCESCLRRKSDREQVRVTWWMRAFHGISAPRGANWICHRCAGKVRRTGIVALLGLSVISAFTLLVLHVAKHHF